MSANRHVRTRPSRRAKPSTCSIRRVAPNAWATSTNRNAWSSARSSASTRIPHSPNPTSSCWPSSRACRRRADAAAAAHCRQAPPVRKTPMPLRALLCLVLLFATVDACATGPAPATRQPHPPGAAIASGHALATQAGLEMIRAGGNAFDAAVAVSATLAVIEPISSGIGGGGFFLLHDGKTGRDIFVDARETAPASATPDKYLDAKGQLDRDKAESGPMSAGIPGLPAALVHLAKKYGRLPLSVSLAPAIRIARAGFDVYPRMVVNYAERKEAMERFAGTRRVYLVDGDPPELGEKFVQPELALTLEQL